MVSARVSAVIAAVVPLVSSSGGDAPVICANFTICDLGSAYNIVGDYWSFDHDTERAVTYTEIPHVECRESPLLIPTAHLSLLCEAQCHVDDPPDHCSGYLTDARLYDDAGANSRKNLALCAASVDDVTPACTGKYDCYGIREDVTTGVSSVFYLVDRSCVHSAATSIDGGDTYTSLHVKTREDVGDCPLGRGVQITGASPPEFNGVYEKLDDSIYRHMVFSDHVMAWHGDRWGWVVGIGDSDSPYGDEFSIAMTSEIVSITPLSDELLSFAVPLVAASADAVPEISSGTGFYDYTKWTSDIDVQLALDIPTQGQWFIEHGKYCQHNNIAVAYTTHELVASHSCSRKCGSTITNNFDTTFEDETRYCEGNGADGAVIDADADALCLPREQCRALCDLLDECVSIDMHNSVPRCYLNTAVCSTGTPELTDGNWNIEYKLPAVRDYSTDARSLFSDVTAAERIAGSTAEVCSQPYTGDHFEVFSYNTFDFDTVDGDVSTSGEYIITLDDATECSRTSPCAITLEEAQLVCAQEDACEGFVARADPSRFAPSDENTASDYTYYVVFVDSSSAAIVGGDDTHTARLDTWDVAARTTTCEAITDSNSCDAVYYCTYSSSCSLDAEYTISEIWVRHPVEPCELTLASSDFPAASGAYSFDNSGRN